MCDSPTAIHLHGCPKRSRQRNKTRSHVEREIVFSQRRWTVTCCNGFAYCLYSALCREVCEYSFCSVDHYWCCARKEMWDFHSIRFMHLCGHFRELLIGPNFVFSPFGSFSKKQNVKVYFFNFESKLLNLNFALFDVRESLLCFS